MSDEPTAWETAANIATTVGVGIALLTVLVTLVMTLRSERLTRQGQKLQRQEAQAAAERSEAAAALTEGYTQRLVEAVEALAANGIGGSASAPPRVKWSLIYQSGDGYLLTNDGDLTAQNVTVSSHESLDLIGLENTPQDLKPGEAVSFLAAVSLATSDLTITVTWQTPGGDFDTWRYPLPYQSRRR